MGALEPIAFIHGIFQMLRDLQAAEFFAPRSVLLPDMLGYGVPKHPARSLASGAGGLRGRADS